MSALYDCQNPRCVDGDAYRAEVSRLQARWDARTEAERALIEQWRERSKQGLGLAFTHDLADELERAIGDGRG